MLGLLLALLGGMMGLAGGGGSGKAAPTVTTPPTTDTPVTVPVADDPVIDDDGGAVADPPADDVIGDPDPMTDDHDDGHGGGSTPADPVDDGHGGGHGGHGGHGGGGTVTDDSGDDGDMPMDDGHGDGHGGGGTVTDDDGGHGGHGGHGGDTVDLPTTPAEIEAFVAEVRAGEETNVHDHDSPLHGEHMQAMELVDPAEASHIAIGHGSWFDPDNWHNGEVPTGDANVVIPKGVYMEYDQESDARLFTVRVDGHLEFAPDVNSKMVVDTFVVAPGGELTIGTEEEPVADDVNVEIIIANNGKIDTDWDPGLLSRGVISHGKTEIFGQVKDTHEKVAEDPMAGDRSIQFDTLPEGWEVGDKIVIAGTHYEGYQYDKKLKENAYNEPEDEVRIITKIEGGEVFFDDPLVHDHDAPRADLKTSVANYSRNVTIKSEDGDDGEIYERGHVMMMHSDDVDIRFAAFEDLGRTDKSAELFGDKDDQNAETSFDSNVAGRYGLHLHRTGTTDQSDPAYLEGNAVFGSPGWGIVHHDSHAVIHNNATYDTFGAGFVAETGNETGSWTDNIAIDAQGVSWGGAKGAHDPGSLNFGITGDGFWFTGRMVEASDNVAASVNHGFIYFHRVPSTEGGKMEFDSQLFEYAEALNFDDDVGVTETPILVFEDNEAFASRMGLHVVKSTPVQGHDIHSVVDGFTGWSVQAGIGIQYTAHYTFLDLDLVGKDGTGNASNAINGVSYGKNTFDITIVDSNIEGFENGVSLKKGFSKNLKAGEDAEHGFTVVNTDVTGNDNGYRYLEEEDTIIGNLNVGKDVTPSLQLDGPLSFDHGKDVINLSGTKTDSLGTKDFPNGPDRFTLKRSDVIDLLKENGYYTTPDGDSYMVLDIYFSDALTGDVYTQSELVAFGEKVPLGVAGKGFGAAQFNGTLSLKDLQAITKDSVKLVRDNDAIDARTLEDYHALAETDDTDGGTAHGSTDHATHTGMQGNQHEGEAMMAALSNGQTPLSESMPVEELVEDHNAQHEMAMV